MTLQQLRYLIAIAETGTISAAAKRMYASQSNLSIALKELENEFGITIFTRTNRGVALTNEGSELLAHARQIVEQSNMLEEHFKAKTREARFAVSTQHYAFCVRAFIDTVEKERADEYDFTMREASTGEIIDDVRTHRSDIGILYIDQNNGRVLRTAFEDAKLEFHPLFEAPVNVFVGEQHPLAQRKRLALEELEAYPRYSFEQGVSNSFFFSEEPLSDVPHKRNIRISDRATLTSLLTDFDGYTLSTGILTPEMQDGIVSIPLETDLTMTVGYLVHKERRLNALLEAYIESLRSVIKSNPLVAKYLDDADVLPDEVRGEQ